MLTKTIKYTDYNGVEREEKFLFNLSKAELMEMELGTVGGLGDMITKIIEAKDVPSIIRTFKSLILKAYGEKSADGKRFVKVDENGQPLSVKFSQTEAYSVLFMELAQDSVAAANFIKGLLPADINIDDVDMSQVPGGAEAMALLNSTNNQPAGNTEAQASNLASIQ